MDEGAKHSSRAVSNSVTRWGATSLLAWLNESLDLDGGDDWSMPLQDLEETAKGGFFCQIFDASFPNDLALKTVVWGSKGNVLDYEVTSNLRLLRQCLHKVGLTPPGKIKLPVSRWISGLEQLRSAQTRQQNLGGLLVATFVRQGAKLYQHMVISARRRKGSRLAPL
ncbi:unnamed protein product [Chrysoparadoxa australica]